MLLLGFCKVDETPKGWYIQYIDRDPETIRRQEEQARKKKQDLDDEERSAKFIEEQVRRGRGDKEEEVRTREDALSFTQAQLCFMKINGVEISHLCSCILIFRKPQFSQSWNVRVKKKKVSFIFVIS